MKFEMRMAQELSTKLEQKPLLEMRQEIALLLQQELSLKLNEILDTAELNKGEQLDAAYDQVIETFTNPQIKELVLHLKDQLLSLLKENSYDILSGNYESAILRMIHAEQKGIFPVQKDGGEQMFYDKEEDAITLGELRQALEEPEAIKKTN